MQTASPSTSTTTPPSIQINGENPALLQIGDTYADLGATATDADGRQLDVETDVNGIPENPVNVDTSVPATDTVDYVATDMYGNTATATRTVIVEAATSQSTTTAQAISQD